jgi:hypothetical protein
LSYIAGLQVPFAPNPNVAQEWIPDPTNTTFKRSRGLIALITNDELHGGTNFNALTITANTLAGKTLISFEYVNTGNERIMRRIIPDSISEDIDNVINTVTHEFGHSFNLDDEYEDFPGDQPNSYDGYDNIAALETIRLDDDYLKNENLDPKKVKWFDLLRIILSDTLTRNSETESGQIKVSIDPKYIRNWVEAKNQNLEAYLRKINVTPQGKQLPLKYGETNYLTELTIGEIDPVNGTILLGGLELPPLPFPVFPKGSLLFLPKLNNANELMYVVENKVLEKLENTKKPLNKYTDTSIPNKNADYPIRIADFEPPCKAYKLIGVYEGGSGYTGMVYRPAGLCKMRTSSDPSFLKELVAEDKSTSARVGDGEFCHVCKYLIVNRVDPSLHELLDKKYYPEAKKND